MCVCGECSVFRYFCHLCCHLCWWCMDGYRIQGRTPLQNRWTAGNIAGGGVGFTRYFCTVRRYLGSVPGGVLDSANDRKSTSLCT